jgi:hypothetical protein
LKTCNHISCNYPVFGKGYCKFHQYLRTDKKPKDEKKPKPRVPIKKVSDKHKKELAVYSVLSKQYKEKNPHCEAKLTGCQYYTSDVHHKAKRGVNLNNIDTWMPVCRSCHHKVETLNADEAREKGFRM